MIQFHGGFLVLLYHMIHFVAAKKFKFTEQLNEEL